MKQVYWIVFILAGAGFTANAQIFSLLKDINADIANSSPANMISANGKLIFTATDGIHGTELWKSDGTEAGTVLIKDINQGTTSSSPSNLYELNGTLYFLANDGVHGSELWKSDGTTAGTVMVKDINPGINGISYFEYLAIGNIFFFNAKDGIHGNELWKSDGTEAGTQLLKDIRPGSFGSYPYSFTEFNGTLYFCAQDSDTGASLWKSDGTVAGTVLIKYAYIAQMKVINNAIIYTGGTDPPTSLGITDGTAAGTTLLTFTGEVFVLTDVNGTAFCCSSNFSSYIKIWKSDGTAGGTQMVKQLSPIPGFSVGLFTNVNGSLFFVGPDTNGGNELWKSDGTTAGTIMVKDIFPGTNTSKPSALTNINGTLYFSATNGVNGNEIWKSDGTDAGTFMVQDINVSGDASPSGFTLVGSKLFVSVNDNIHGRELWIGDVGTNASLPLTLSAFKAQLSGNDGFLNWKTSSEQNTSHFEIERSIDGRNFIKAGTITAAGNSSTEKQYNYRDKNISLLGATVIYYRLKTIDADGKFMYSKVVAISIDDKEAVTMLYPNPAKENMTLMISVPAKENIIYTIIDQTGRSIRQKNIVAGEGSNIVTIETASIPPGQYTLMLKGKSVNRSMNFLKF